MHHVPAFARLDEFGYAVIGWLRYRRTGKRAVTSKIVRPYLIARAV